MSQIESTDKAVTNKGFQHSSISDIILNRSPKLRFDERDIAEYNWNMTCNFYGQGHYLGFMEYDSRISHGTVPILFNDNRTWSVPMYRHLRQKLQFFIPGIVLGMPNRIIYGYDFYPLSDEEKKAVKDTIHEKFDLKVLKETEALKQVYSSYFDEFPDIKKVPGDFKFLFGNELYEGEDPEEFRIKGRKRIHNSKREWTVEIYV
jgi:hypothetical protein